MTLIVTVLLLSTSAGSRAATLLERMVASTGPCQELHARLIGMDVGINYLKALSIPNVDITVRTDAMTVSVEGTIACQTSSESIPVLRGDVSAKLKARAEFDMGSCTVVDSIVDLSDFGGRYASAAEALSQHLEATLDVKLRDALIYHCKALHAHWTDGR